MRSVIKTGGRRWHLGWLLPLALLALPNCFLSGKPFDEQPDTELEFQPGEFPTSAVMCEIPKPLAENESECATDEEIDLGISFAAAGTALVTEQGFPIALDWSDDAQDQCGVGRPRKTKFYDTYPDGVRVCLNCETQMPNPYASPAEVCIAKCQALLHSDELLLENHSPHEDLIAFCEANARVAINVDPTKTCELGACTVGGNPEETWHDPRKDAENVMWTDASPGVSVFGADNNSLKRDALTSSDFDEGAASGQTIPRGDAWVEFAAGQDGRSHVIGLRESCKEQDLALCPDNDYGLTGIGFSISLNVDGMVYVLEPTDPPGGLPNVVGPFGPYVAFEKYRLKVTERSDGRAAISYERMQPDGSFKEFAKSETVFPKYPLRVDAIFREEGATLENVTIVRIKQQQP